MIVFDSDAVLAFLKDEPGAAEVERAEALNCLLLTADARLAAAPGIRCPVVTVRT